MKITVATQTQTLTVSGALSKITCVKIPIGVIASLQPLGLTEARTDQRSQLVSAVLLGRTLKVMIAPLIKHKCGAPKMAKRALDGTRNGELSKTSSRKPCLRYRLAVHVAVAARQSRRCQVKRLSF